MSPDDHDRVGAVSHDVPCPDCRHDHSVLPCDWCACGIWWRPGIDF